MLALLDKPQSLDALERSGTLSRRALDLSLMSLREQGLIALSEGRGHESPWGADTTSPDGDTTTGLGALDADDEGVEVRLFDEADGADADLDARVGRGVDADRPGAHSALAADLDDHAVALGAALAGPAALAGADTQDPSADARDAALRVDGPGWTTVRPFPDITKRASDSGGDAVVDATNTP